MTVQDHPTGTATFDSLNPVSFAIARFVAPLAVAELPIIFWLVIQGAKPEDA